LVRVRVGVRHSYLFIQVKTSLGEEEEGLREESVRRTLKG
jgi:hypothetical protein